MRLGGDAPNFVGTFHSAMTGTFQSDTGGTSIPLLSQIIVTDSVTYSRCVCHGWQFNFSHKFNCK